MITDEQTFAIVRQLPEWSYIRCYVAYAYARSDAPAIYHLVTALSHLATVASPDLHARLTVPIYPNLYAILIGDSGYSRKTTSIMLGDEILGEVARKRIGPEPASWEALFEGLVDQPTQLVRMMEFGRFLSSSSGSAATNYYAKLRTALIDLYDCSPIDRRKAKGKTIKVKKPRLSLLAACAPPFLEQHTGVEDWTGGFLGRFFVCWAQKTREMYEPPDMPEAATWLKAKLAGLFLSGTAHSEYPYIGMTPEARTLWIDWNREMERRFDAELQPWARACAARVPVVAIKVMTLLSLDLALVPDQDGGAFVRTNSALSGDAWYCEVDMLKIAIAIAELHLQSLIGILQHLSSNDYERARVTVLQAIGAQGRSKRSIMRRLQPRMHARQLAGILDSMLMAGDIESVVQGLETLYAVSELQQSDNASLHEPVDITRQKPSGSTGGAPKGTPTETPDTAAPDAPEAFDPFDDDSGDVS